MRKRSQILAELAEAEKNHAASNELIEMHAGKARFVALAIASRDRFAAEILRLQREREEQCQP